MEQTQETLRHFHETPPEFFFFKKKKTGSWNISKTQRPKYSLWLDTGNVLQTDANLISWVLSFLQAVVRTGLRWNCASKIYPEITNLAHKVKMLTWLICPQKSCKRDKKRLYLSFCLMGGADRRTMRWLIPNMQWFGLQYFLWRRSEH